MSMILNGQHMLCEDAIEELYTSCLISKQNEGLLCRNGVGVFKCLSHYGI